MTQEKPKLSYSARILFEPEQDQLVWQEHVGDNAETYLLKITQHAQSEKRENDLEMACAIYAPIDAWTLQKLRDLNKGLYYSRSNPLVVATTYAETAFYVAKSNHQEKHSLNSASHGFLEDFIVYSQGLLVNCKKYLPHETTEALDDSLKASFKEIFAYEAMQKAEALLLR